MEETRERDRAGTVQGRVARERTTFEHLCAEFERSHFADLTETTVRGHRTYLKQLKAFFGESKLDRITVEMIEEYRDQRRRQPTKTQTQIERSKEQP